MRSMWTAPTVLLPVTFRWLLESQPLTQATAEVTYPARICPFLVSGIVVFPHCNERIIEVCSTSAGFHWSKCASA
ncbi:hypothetical protein KC19_VG058300 [Ceratodon purpureus]|uniref:Secreted protein n=1 Tax=Ceratodon purpureus TaxID=3225 RepID=A0A8T0HMC7_CERPU|nr:hypothetical protein KC19_VG058300 [Ceratodon purpureus]